MRLEYLKQQIGVAGAGAPWGSLFVAGLETVLEDDAFQDRSHELAQRSGSDGSGGGVLHKVQLEAEHHRLQATMKGMRPC
jgi:hypothetical protein